MPPACACWQKKKKTKTLMKAASERKHTCRLRASSGKSRGALCRTLLRLGPSQHSCIHSLGVSFLSLLLLLCLCPVMICCVGLVEEFSKAVVLRRLKVLPVPYFPSWAGGGPREGDALALAEERERERRGRTLPSSSDGGCGGFWSRCVKYPVGICLAGCAAGAG